MGIDDEHYSAERRVGRVLEARVWALDDVTAADRYSADLGKLVAALPRGTRGILCADHRFAEIYPQRVSDRLLELFRQMNTRLERVAILVHPRQATFHMQLSRLVREAAYEGRQLFRDPAKAVEYLAPLLSVEERARAEAFLAETPDPARTRGLHES